MRKWSMSILGICVMYSLAAQSTVIQWSNPSFEDIPGPGRPPLGWYFCGPPEETPPDVQPVEQMSVIQKAIHGKTYAGLVVRDNNTQETLGQSLSQTLFTGTCYMFHFYACRSEAFASYSRLTLEPTNFIKPIKLQIWAGNQHCDRKYLVAETEAVTDTSWQVFRVFFNPPANCDQLFFTATYDETITPYNGHLMIDHLSPIIAVDCQDPAVQYKPSDHSDPEAANNDLAQKIKNELAGIQWVRNGFSLQQEFLPNPEKPDDLVVGNRSIFQISNYLKAHTEALLTVAVGPRKDPLVQHHIRLLAAEFMASGLPPGRCLIRPMKNRDLKKGNWLNAGEKDADELWGLSFH